MDNEKWTRRDGWQGIVFDSPARILIAFVLVIAGFCAADWLANFTDSHGALLYGLFVWMGQMPFTVFGFLALWRVPVRLAVLGWSALIPGAFAGWAGDWAVAAVGVKGYMPVRIVQLAAVVCVCCIAIIPLERVERAHCGKDRDDAPQPTPR